MDDTAHNNKQLGLLDLSVDLSVPEVYSGTEFTLYLHVKNPFSRPVWIKSVELSLPTQLSAREPSVGIKEDSKNDKINSDFIRKMIADRESEIKRLRSQIMADGTADSDRAKAESRLEELENRTRIDLASLSRALIIEPTGESQVVLNAPRAANVIAKSSEKSVVVINNYQGSSEPERVPLTSSLPLGSSLQPGSTDVWTIRLGSRKTPLFIPAKFKLQLTVIYGLESPSADPQEREKRDLYSNTSSSTVQVRAALWGVILGGGIGGILGSVARSFQGSGWAAAFSGTRISSTIGAIVLAAILSGAAVVFSARKSDTQSFVTVEDFWGGILVGFLIGYSGTAAFAKITGVQA